MQKLPLTNPYSVARTLALVSSKPSLVQVRLPDGTLRMEAGATSNIPLRLMPGDTAHDVLIFINDHMGQTHETYLLKVAYV